MNIYEKLKYNFILLFTDREVILAVLLMIYTRIEPAAWNKGFPPYTVLLSLIEKCYKTVINL